MGDWVGSYVCPMGQGLTGLTLTVTAVTGPVVNATFNFYAPSLVSTIPSGSYTLAGTYDAASGAFHLYPLAWVKQPPAYMMIGMEGVFDTAAGTASGKVDTGCAHFQLSRPCADNKPIASLPAPLTLALSRGGERERFFTPSPLRGRGSG